MPFATLKSVLLGALKRAGIHRQMESFLICQEANKLIEEILQSQCRGGALAPPAPLAQAQYIKNRVLYIKVENPVIASELNLRKRDILESLSQKFGAGKVEDILFK